MAVYVNCWERRSVYSVVQSMVESLRILGAEAQDTNVKMDRIRQVVKDRPVAIVLDDVDRVAPGERDRIIEALLALPRAGLVCISDRKDALLELDERIRSRLSPTLIRFPPYAAKEVEEILQDRARRALLPDCWSRQALRTLADGAGGDARAAIQGLRLAAVTAEDQRRKNVSSAELPGPVSATVETRQERATRQLSYHQRLIYELARERQPVPTSKLRRAYASKCAASGVTPVARRTFSKYVRALRDADLISVDDRCVGGSGRLIRLTATRSETGRARGPSAASRGSAP